MWQITRTILEILLTRTVASEFMARFRMFQSLSSSSPEMKVLLADFLMKTDAGSPIHGNWLSAGIAKEALWIHIRRDLRSGVVSLACYGRPLSSAQDMSKWTRKCAI